MAIAVVLVGVATSATALAQEAIKVRVSRFAFPGSWTVVADAIKANGIDRKHGIDLELKSYSTIAAYYGALTTKGVDLTARTKVGAAISWAVVVAAALVGGQIGPGYMVVDAATVLQIDDVYVGVVLIGFIGLAGERIFVAIERRFVPWAGR